MRISRKDIAKIAGVSEQTVSYILNNTRKFSDEVMQRVLSVVEQYGYKPDMIAKSMTKKKTYTVAILVNDVSNPIFGEIFHGFQESASQAGYAVYFADAMNGFRNQVADLISRRIDGVYISLINSDVVSNVIDKFTKNEIKVVTGNKFDNFKLGYGCVEIDMAQGMRKLIAYLKSVGHTDIAYLSGLREDTVDLRYKAFKDEYRNLMGKEGTVIDNEYPYDTSVQTGMQLTAKLIESGCKATAIITTNDLMAYGALSELQKRGIRVPEDVSVVGFDDILYSNFVSPALTTVTYDKNAYGRKVFNILSHSIENNVIGTFEKYETEIVIRKSVASPK